VAALAVLAAGAPGALSAATAVPCPSFCGRSNAGPELVAFRQLRGDTVRIVVVLKRRGAFELIVSRWRSGRLVSARPTAIGRQPGEVLSGRMPVGGGRKLVARIRLRSAPAGLRARVVDLSGGKGLLTAGVYIVRVNALTRSGAVREPGSSIVLRLKRNGNFVPLLGAHRAPAPSAATGAASSVTPSGATVTGQINPRGQMTSYYFQYGTSTAYGARTAAQGVGWGTRALNVSASLGGLSAGSTVHYRLVATNCPGCSWGVRYGGDRTFTTLPAPSPQQLAATRAVATYAAMQQYFSAASVYPGDQSGLYAGDYPQTGNHYSFLWPFSRALAGTITLAGIPSALLGGLSYQADVADRLAGLAHYWDGSGYESYPPMPYGAGGDKYYDDQAWIGLATAQNYAITGDPTSLADAKNVFNFVYPGGWAGTAGFDPGGIYWVQQGVGVGASNHSRTANSTAPNAEIALLLENFDPANATVYDAGASAMYGWVNQYLYNVQPNPNYDPSQPALIFDSVTPAGNAINKTLYTYNQGTMIAANVREYLKTGNSAYLSAAEAIASTSLSTFNESYYLTHSAAFNAIFFRGLLVLYSATRDAALQSQIIQTIRTYAEDAWNDYRTPEGLFKFPYVSPVANYQLLDQGAMLQIYSMLAWSPADYADLP
jgi:hypothetical protein